MMTRRKLLADGSCPMKKSIAAWLRRIAYRLDPVTHIELYQMQLPEFEALPPLVKGQPVYYAIIDKGTFRVWPLPLPDGELRLSYKVGE